MREATESVNALEGKPRMSVKLVYCLTRKKGLTREQFQDYWLNMHAPLVASVKKHNDMYVKNRQTVIVCLKHKP